MTLYEFLEKLCTYLCNNLQNWCNDVLEPTPQIEYIQNPEVWGGEIDELETQVLIGGRFTKQIGLVQEKMLTRRIETEMKDYQTKFLQAPFYYSTTIRFTLCRFLIILS